MFTEDLTAFFNPADFGETVTVNAVPVLAIFDSGYSSGNVGSVSMATSKPMLTLPTSAVPATLAGASVVVRGVNYSIGLHEPDGTGVSTLHLEKNSWAP